MPARKGPPPQIPTDRDREVVRRMALLGLPQELIATALGKSKPYLHKYFRAELDEGLRTGAEAVASSLFGLMRKGNVAATIFLAKVRLGWSERQHLVHSGDVALLVTDATRAALHKARSTRRPRPGVPSGIDEDEEPEGDEEG